MKVLFVSPQAGMCNRFRVLCSAILLACLSGRKLYHCWEEETPHVIDLEIIQHMRESSLSTFFVEDAAIPFQAVNETTKIDQVFSEWGPEDFWYAVQSSAIRRNRWSGAVHIERSSADALLKSQADTVLLETSLCLQPSSFTPDEFERALSDIYSQHFKPLPLFQDVVDRFVRGPYVGVHIRRTDHLRYFCSASINEKNWEEIIRLHVDSAKVLYVCSDDKPFVDTLAGLLSDYSIVPVDLTFSSVPKFQAFIEFLCLARAERIYGTVGSGFSREAARFGGLPFVLCSVKPPENIWERMLRCFGMGTQQAECTEVSRPKRSLPSGA